MRSIKVLFATCLFAVAIIVGQSTESRAQGDRIQPYAENPRYWQYEGEPVLLLGGSEDDNLFQIPDLEEHLNLLASVGGNYIRNTMSARVIKGFEIQAFGKSPDGKFDLDQWNEEYWDRFETLLRLADEREIIVQIEVWDRFDYTDYGRFQSWSYCPYNPANNVNYTPEESGLETAYPAANHPSADKQPFFHTVPEMDDNIVPRKYQEAFVDKMLSHSLRYGNVLYCMNNETSTSPAWGQYWMTYIQDRASQAGVEVFTTDMFDEGWDLRDHADYRVAFDAPGLYTFLDISQNNANKNTVAKHWENIRFAHDRTQDDPRPINNVKVYGSDEYPPVSAYQQRVYYRWGSQSALRSFVMNVLGGCASTRFHRNESNGLGLTEPARNCIEAVRKLESLIKMWEVDPDDSLLSEHDAVEVFLAAKAGEQYAIYFVDGGSTVLTLPERHDYQLRWISIETGRWGPEGSLVDGGKTAISAPAEGGWIATVIRQ